MTLPGDRAAARDWHDRAVYRALHQLDRADLDWTCAHQHPRARRASPHVTIEHVSRGAASLPLLTLDRARPWRNAGGYEFCLSPGAPPVTFWPAARDRPVLVAEARRVAAGGADALDLVRLGNPVTILRTGDGIEQVVIADGVRRIRLQLHGDSAAHGPVRLRYGLSGFHCLDAPIHSLRRLFALRRLGRFPRVLFPHDHKAARYVRALQAWDGFQAGARQLDIAVAVYGDHMLSADGSNFDALRKCAGRLIRLAEQRIEAGYRRFHRH